MDNKKTIYIVGDSTLASFKDEYYYPRYGYGTQIANYFTNIDVKNLAISGRSSKSYLKDPEYTYLLNNIKADDYLIVGFGHNDEKDEDPNRFTAANKPSSDKTSFAYYLNTYYIKPAKDKGAIPILCTPIVRANPLNDYTKNAYHITKNGNYREAILNLGKEAKTTVIDLTEETKNIYSKIGYNEAIYYHAWPKAKPETVDTTHLNVYGAKMVAYLFAKLLEKTNNSLKDYLKQPLVAPIKAKDLIANPNYTELPYTPFVADSYKPTPNFANISAPWFATAFGDTGSNPLQAATGYFVKEKDNQLIIGQDGAYLKGRIANTEGIVFAFRQIDNKDNFKISANAKIIAKKIDFEAGFGLMLRDDIYLNQAIPDSSILSNYVACGIYNDDKQSNIIYKRENKNLVNSGYLAPYYQVGDCFQLELERLGQVVNIWLKKQDMVYKYTYTDFDFLAIDNKYMYLGFYATKGTVISLTEINFNYTGKSQGA